MYLFEHTQRAQLYDWPYPHLVIQNALDPALAKLLALQLNCENPPPLWQKVIEENLNRRSSETVEYLDSIFEQPTTDVRVHEANFADLSNYREPELIRDWHLDSSMKKYQTLYFLGNCTKGGEHEMLEEATGMKKVISFTHNMLLAWHNSHEPPTATHRFYSGQGQRYTLNIPIDYSE
jgi:hypothetical protein